MQSSKSTTSAPAALRLKVPLNSGFSPFTGAYSTAHRGFLRLVHAGVLPKSMQVFTNPVDCHHLGGQKTMQQGFHAGLPHQLRALVGPRREDSYPSNMPRIARYAVDVSNLTI
eukprot:5724559-Amphidinium_carterae.1